MPGLISCTGVTGSGCITYHAYATCIGFMCLTYTCTCVCTLWAGHVALYSDVCTCMCCVRVFLGSSAVGGGAPSDGERSDQFHFQYASPQMCG